MNLSATTILTSGFLLLACAVSFGQDTEIPRAIPVDVEPMEAEPVAVDPAAPARTFGEVASSESGQFRVRGGDGALRASVAMLADRTRDDFLRLTGEHESNPDFDVPIYISLIGSPGEASPPRTISKSITYNDGKYQLRIHIHIGRGLDNARFEHAITSALVYERSLANHTENDAETPLLVGPWLVEGLREANQWRTGTSNRRLYEALFRSGGLFKLDELFTMTEAAHESLDGATRAAFQVSSGALVMALLEQPDGRGAFRNLLGEVAKFAGEMPALLRLHFPDLNLSENSLAKWWALQLANKGTARLTESLNVFESEANLEDALQLRFRDQDGEMREIPVTQWADLAELDEADRTDAVRMAEDALVRLSYRCFPTFRPLLVSYLSILNQIAHHPGRGDTITRQLGELAETRANMIDMADRARDYMDWFEITRARETSGAFDDYLRLKAQLSEAPASTRQDPVSDTLNRLDAIFHRETDGHQGFHHRSWSSHHLPSHR